ncbi:MAG: AAA family ATPase [Melioribacteraceae bacterium]|jgi:exonuclease SbcC|nr:AAA family ATPase [Melioribacteraceae bacterium]
MISSITIQNFESHEHTDIELSPGVNVFIGSTDNGKSGIIRALKWLLANRPLGDSFRSHWGGDTSVALTLENDFQVVREKGKSAKDNCYRISTTPNSLEAPGTTVPEPVAQLLNIDEINTQYQLDRPFLLLNTPGEVAKYLNKIVNWEAIDRAQSYVKTKKNDLNRTIKSRTYDLEKKEESLKKYDYIDDFEIDLKALEKKNNFFISLKDKYTSLFKSIQLIESIQKDIEANKKNYPSEKEIDSYIKKTEQLEKLNDSYETLNSQVRKIETLKIQLSDMRKKYSKKKEMLDKLTPETCPLCNQKMPKK